MSKRKRDKYPYYSVKLPRELADLFKKFITKHRIGYRNVSSFILHILQNEAERLMEKYPDLLEKDENEEK